MNPLTVGIIGAAGQVGSSLLKALTEDGRVTPVGICRNHLSAARLASQGFEVRTVRTDDAVQLGEAIHGLEKIVNCALPLPSASEGTAVNNSLANSLVAACKGKQLIHLSSVAVYGEFTVSRPQLFNSPQPDSRYGRQKLHMERLLRRLADKQSVECTILRVGHVYGAGLNWSDVLFDIIRDPEFTLPFDGHIVSNAISITNVVAAIRELLLGTESPAVTNLADFPQTSWRDVFDLHTLASDRQPVDALSSEESERRFREHKKRAETGMAGRLMSQSWRWLRQLPGSYVRSVPVLKDMFAGALQAIGSEVLEGKIRAFYWKNMAARAFHDVRNDDILPCFFSESMPGPHLRYQGTTPTVDLAALQAYYDAISVPVGKMHSGTKSRGTHPESVIAGWEGNSPTRAETIPSRST